MTHPSLYDDIDFFTVAISLAFCGASVHLLRNDFFSRSGCPSGATMVHNVVFLRNQSEGSETDYSSPCVRCLYRVTPLPKACFLSIAPLGAGVGKGLGDYGSCLRWKYI